MMATCVVSQARVMRLEGINRDVSRRLGNAVETIRSVLDAAADGAR